MEIRRLHPDPGTISLPEDMIDLGLAAHAPGDRPYVLLNMVSSADGRAALQGGSTLLSNPADRLIFHALRAQVDAVLAGTGTLRAEGYRRLVRDPERRAARGAQGLEPDPLAVVLSRSGDLDGVGILQDPDQPRAVFTGDEADPGRAFARLRSEHGVRVLLCEGGPTLNGSLLAAGLVDELFLSVSPLLAGGAGPATVIGAALEPAVGMDLVWALEHESCLFLRYRVGIGRG
jgi:riboflavin biosynthesis pyrimidine reductase